MYTVEVGYGSVSGINVLWLARWLSTLYLSLMYTIDRNIFFSFYCIYVPIYLFIVA